jgi:hypothetical protein
MAAASPLESSFRIAGPDLSAVSIDAQRATATAARAISFATKDVVFAALEFVPIRHNRLLFFLKNLKRLEKSCALFLALA